MSDARSSTTAHRGFFPFVKGGMVAMHQAGSVAVVAHGDVEVREGGAQIMLAGGDLSVREGGAQAILARGDVTIREGGGLVVAGRAVEVDEGWVGLALGSRVDLRGARVALTPIAALCLGAGFGIAVTASRRALRR